MKIAIIGNGVMGKQIFDCFSDRGIPVSIYGKDSKYKLENVSMVIEAIDENKTLKKRLFRSMDKLCNSDCIFATNTSSLSISELAKATKRKDRFIGLHFINPVSKMDLVEITRGKKTSDKTFSIAQKFVFFLGKVPIVSGDTPGFILNRILFPMINEAIECLRKRVASKEDIDMALVLGANHPIGPLALADLIGLDTCILIMRNLGIQPSMLLTKMVRTKHLGKKNKKGFYDY